MAWIEGLKCPGLKAEITTTPGPQVLVYMKGRKLELWPATEEVSAALTCPESCGHCPLNGTKITVSGALQRRELPSRQEVFAQSALTTAVNTLVEQVNKSIPPACPRLTA